MSSVSNRPPEGAAPPQYNDQQKAFLQNVDNVAKREGAAASAGDADGVKKARQELKDLYGQAKNDKIFSRDDLKNVIQQTHQEAVASFIGAQKKAGKPLDDKAAAATLHNDYDAYAKKHGLDAKSSDTFNKWKAAITPDLQKAGLSADDITKTIDAAQKFRFSPGLGGLQQRRDVRV